MAFFMQFFAILTTSVSWFNTSVDIPLNADLNQYLEVPEAVLVVDGKQLNVVPYYQRNGVNYTFQSTINTGVLRTYTLYYEAYFENYDIRSEYQIIFHIYDDIPPVITRLPTFTIEVDDKPPDLSIGFQYEDNYDDIASLHVIIDDHQVNYDVIGTYYIRYTVVDQSYKEISEISTIEIVDRKPPMITLKKQIVIERGEHIEYKNFVEIEDTYDISPVVVYHDDNVKRMTVGNYQLIITAIDQSGNESAVTTTVIVRDTKPPDLILQSNPKPMNVFDEDVLDHLAFYVIDIIDLNEHIDVSEVHISHDIQIDRLGTYHIHYQVSDAYGNLASKDLNIDVVDEEAPTVTCLYPLVFRVNDTIPFLNTYFDIKDNYDAESLLMIEISEDVSYDIVGNYQIIITATDQSDNSIRYEGYVEIIDDTKPIIEQINDIVITDFNAHVLTSYFDVYDNYDAVSFIEIYIDDSKVDYQTIGIYEIIVHVTDTSGNLELFHTDLFIIDVVKPNLVLTKPTLKLSVDDILPNFESFILDVSDNYDHLTVQDIEISDDVNMQVVGVYQVRYEVKDLSGNENDQFLTVIIDDMHPPVVALEDITIHQYDNINLYDNVDIIEETSTYEIICYPNVVNTDMPGEQIVTYIIQDARGNYTKKLRKITILPASSSYTLEDFIPAIVIVISGILIMFVIKKRE